MEIYFPTFPLRRTACDAGITSNGKQKTNKQANKQRNKTKKEKTNINLSQYLQ